MVTELLLKDQEERKVSIEMVVCLLLSHDLIGQIPLVKTLVIISGLPRSSLFLRILKAITVANCLHRSWGQRCGNLWGGRGAFILPTTWY